MNLITKIFLLLSLLSMHSSIIARGNFDSEFNTHGKQLLQQQCTLCHQLNKITGSSGYTLGQWQELISTMTDLSNHPERDLLTTYLATHYPPNQNRQPTLRAASLPLDFKEWVVPTLGQRSRDPKEKNKGNRTKINQEKI